jgi:hypothetical protein
MKILIKKGEYLFNQNGHHVLDSKGFAIKASEDTECEVNEEASGKVLNILNESRKLLNHANEE